jgi:NAD(P)-dependent dehydrogenase (short-subunit alcohol dehydrogenase family)
LSAQLAARSANVIAADISDEGIAETLGLVESQGNTALGIKTDVAKEADFEHLRDIALERFGKVDLIINNAAVLVNGLPTEVPIEEWERVLSINLLAAVRSVRVFAPTLIAQGSGHFVNIASTAGLWPYSFDRLPYCSSKAAVIMMSEGLGLWLRPLGVGVTCFAPGGVAGGLLKNSLRYYGERQPVHGAGFVADKVEDVARMVLDAVTRDAVLALPSKELHQTVVEHHQDPDVFTAMQLERIARGDHIIATS